ncbi:MAG: hypothetical protein AAF609_04205 [Cyanobacteria bacterium P01_C01_bin.120]
MSDLLGQAACPQASPIILPGTKAIAGFTFPPLTRLPVLEMVGN